MPRAIIMAGGEGTRLRPFTHTIPKPLLPIGRKPVAQILVEQLCEQGLRDIIITLGHNGDIIRAYFQDGSRFGARITYFQESYKMGTAGCLAHLELGEEPVVVTNGDLLTDVDFAEFLTRHVASGASMSVGVRHQAVKIPYGVVTISADGQRLEAVEEKPEHAFTFNAGIYALSAGAVGQVPGTGVFDMTDLMGKLIRAGLVVRPEVLQGLWYDLAQVEDFDKALTYLAESPEARKFLDSL